jgi:hypothetical protein
VVKFDLSQCKQNHQEQDELLIRLLIDYMNLIVKKANLEVDRVNSFTYDNAIEKLQSFGHLSLSNFRQLSFSDMDKLCFEIRRWRVYGNNDPTQLRSSNFFSITI